MADTPTITVFILGCGPMQVPALRIAGEMGWRVVAADGNPRAVGRELCDEFLPIDLKDTGALVEAAARISGGAGPDGVFTAGTDFSLSVAIVAEALDLPGHTKNAALLATDKVLMRKAFRDAGVPSPAFSEVGPGDDARDASSRVPGPWVVKPVDSMGARGVVRIDDPGLLAEALEEARRFSRSGRALVESYMEGPEYSLDALVEDGRVIRCGLADRHIVYPPRFIEIGHTIPSKAEGRIAEDLWRTFGEGIAALGLTRGAAKGDVKLTPEGPMIGEIAGRLSGGYMSGWTWPYASGVEPTRGALRLAVGLDAGISEPSSVRICAERALVGIDGTVRKLEGAEEALALPGVKEVFLRYSPGEKLAFPRNNVEKAGNVIAVAGERREAEERAKAALRALRLELDPDDPSTGDYLDAGGPFPPDAYYVGDALRELWERRPPRPSRGCPVEAPVVVLPDALRDEEDYAGLTMAEAVDILEGEGLLRGAGGLGGDSGSESRMRSQATVAGAPGEAPATEESILSDFMKALVRGGLPGARWYLEKRPGQ